MQVYAAMMDHRIPLVEVGAFAERMERLGFDGIHVPEATHDPFTVSALALEHTTRVIVRTAVALAFPRSPMVTAYTSWDLARFSGGRFQVGLGTQVRPHIVERFSAPYDNPVARLTEYVESICAIFHAFQTGEPLDYKGRFYSFTRLSPFFNPGPMDVPSPPLWIGGVNPGTTQLAGARAAGFISHPTNSSPRYLDAVTLPNLRAGLSRGGRDLGDLQIVVGSLFITGIDEETLACQRDKQRVPLAFTLSTPAYWPTLEMRGWQQLGRDLRKLTRAQLWDDLPGLLTDEVLDTLVPQATYDVLPGVVEQWFGKTATGIVLEPPDDPAHDEAFAETIRAIQTQTVAPRHAEAVEVGRTVAGLSDRCINSGGAT
jgi:probable F420-dependent oxidoreductase